MRREREGLHEGRKREREEHMAKEKKLHRPPSIFLPSSSQDTQKVIWTIHSTNWMIWSRVEAGKRVHPKGVSRGSHLQESSTSEPDFGSDSHLVLISDLSFFFFFWRYSYVCDRFLSWNQYVWFVVLEGTLLCVYLFESNSSVCMCVLIWGVDVGWVRTT